MNWCILIPLLVGLLCAILGYLLGRLFGKGNNNLEEKVVQLEADLEACNTSKLSLKKQGDELNIWRDKTSKLEADLAACKEANSGSVSSDEIDVWKTKFSNLEADLVASKQANLGLVSGDELDTWKIKLSKLEADYKTQGDELNIWKNKVANLKTDLEACNASKLSLETDLSATKTTVNLIPFNGDAAKAVFGKKIKQDDLKLVEGIGPKIEGLFHNFDIKTWKALSEASVEKCQEVLDSGGDRYKIHNPGTWPKQAELAYEGKWAELLKWQDELDGGKA